LFRDQLTHRVSPADTVPRVNTSQTAEIPGIFQLPTAGTEASRLLATAISEWNLRSCCTV